MNANLSNVSEIYDFFDNLSQETGRSTLDRKVYFLKHSSTPAQLSLNSEEITWAGRLAWRNSERCIGRLPWKSLKCFDAQEVSTPLEVFESCLRHLSYSTNKGKIIPTMTFFPHEDMSNRFRILNDQLIRYAGYSLASGEVIGDPEQVKLTDLALKAGWIPPSPLSPFDVLPLIIEDAAGKLTWFSIPSEYVLEVPIVHPTYTWFEEFQLKWIALPAVSNKLCRVAGLNYTCAPFSGYYMGTEIAARNFGDTARYNMLPKIAERMALDIRSKHSLWKDRALIELNTAVLYSYKLAGVTIIDHHTASEQFMKHLKSEKKCQRNVPGDWSWLVPPISGSACPVFHQYYSDERPLPKFYDQKSPDGNRAL